MAVFRGLLALLAEAWVALRSARMEITRSKVDVGVGLTADPAVLFSWNSNC